MISTVRLLSLFAKEYNVGWQLSSSPNNWVSGFRQAKHKHHFNESKPYSTPPQDHLSILTLGTFVLGCSQSPIFLWDRRDIARFTVNIGHLSLLRNDNHDGNENGKKQ